MFCQNRKVEPKGEASSVSNAWSTTRIVAMELGKMSKKWFYHMRGENIKKMAFKKIFHLLFSHCPELVLCQVLKKKTSCIAMLLFKNIAGFVSKKFQKWQLGLEVGGLQMKKAIPCVEIEQRRGKKKKWVSLSRQKSPKIGIKSSKWWQSC